MNAETQRQGRRAETNREDGRRFVRNLKPYEITFLLASFPSARLPCLCVSALNDHQKRRSSLLRRALRDEFAPRCRADLAETEVVIELARDSVVGFVADQDVRAGGIGFEARKDQA